MDKACPTTLRRSKIWLILVPLVLAFCAYKLTSAKDILDLTDEQQRVLVDQTAEWVRSKRTVHRPLALPLANSEIEIFGPYFPKDILEQARVRALDEMPSPDFAEGIRRDGQRVFDFSRVHGLALGDTVLLKGAGIPPGSPARRAVLFHELVHSVQYKALGIDAFFAHYLASLVSTGRYGDIVFENQAFELQHRFSVEPGRAFSVEDEVEKLIGALGCGAEAPAGRVPSNSFAC